MVDNKGYIKTNDTMSEKEIRDFLDCDPDETPGEIIGVCAGEWRCERQLADLPCWRFWRDPEW